MNISEIVSYDKDGEVEHFSLFQKLFLSLIIILIASLSFGIGRLSVAGTGNREPIKIEYDQSLIQDSVSLTTPQQVSNTASAIKAIPSQTVGTGEVVVSKNGSRYHYLHCSGAKQIKEGNKIVFASSAAAEAAGYTLALNCKPL